jgi:hypothetical protein
MFDSLSTQEKTQREYRAGQRSPRETFSTFLRTVNEGRLDEAAACLELDDIPLSARDNLGPVLAVKLKVVIDRIGPAARTGGAGTSAAPGARPVAVRGFGQE